MKPHRAKTRIVVLGNHEECYFSKGERFVPFLASDSLHLLTSRAVGKCHVLLQGDCKNAFCNATMPDDEVTIVCPPQGDPDAKEGN